MSQPLPYKDHKFSDISIDDVLKTSDDNDEGYILEVDLISILSVDAAISLQYL